MTGLETEVLQRIGWLFRGVNVGFREGIDAALRRSGTGLSFSQVSTLSILSVHPGINGAQLARHNMVSPQAMTAVLRQLTAKRLLEKRAHPDSDRADSWHLTDKGVRALARGRAAFAEVTNRMLSGLAPAEVAALERAWRSRHRCAAAAACVPLPRLRTPEGARTFCSG
jgi:DNA-binding MarR family transcriptional regulator